MYIPGCGTGVEGDGFVDVDVGWVVVGRNVVVVVVVRVVVGRNVVVVIGVVVGRVVVGRNVAVVVGVVVGRVVVGRNVVVVVGLVVGRVVVGRTVVVDGVVVEVGRVSASVVVVVGSVAVVVATVVVVDVLDDEDCVVSSGVVSSVENDSPIDESVTIGVIECTVVIDVGSVIVATEDSAKASVEPVIIVCVFGISTDVRRQDNFNLHW